MFADGDRIKPANTDFANLIVRFSSGATITFQASWSQSAQEGWCVDLFGTDGRLRASAPSFPTVADCMLEAGEAGPRDGRSLQPVPLEQPENPSIDMGWTSSPTPSYPMALTMHSLVQSINAAGEPVPDFALALEVERVLEAARLSSAERRWVALSTG